MRGGDGLQVVYQQLLPQEVAGAPELDKMQEPGLHVWDEAKQREDDGTVSAQDLLCGQEVRLQPRLCVTVTSLSEGWNKARYLCTASPGVHDLTATTAGLPSSGNFLATWSPSSKAMRVVTCKHASHACTLPGGTGPRTSMSNQSGVIRNVWSDQERPPSASCVNPFHVHDCCSSHAGDSDQTRQLQPPQGLSPEGGG